MNDKKEKAKESLANVWKKTADISKKAASEISKGAKNLSDQTKESIKTYQLNKYKPLSAKEFKSKSFNIPNVIEIVDDAVRRDIVVCEGAIGWTETHKDVEVLHLYDEYINKSGLNFVPVACCDNVYYVDPFDKTRFINVSDIYAKTTEEKIAELENIAYCLGAKSCSVEIIESNAEVSSTKIKTIASVNNVPANAACDISNKKANKQSGKAISYFEGHDSPKRPQLKWFAHDDSIKALIEMRLADAKSIKSRVLELKSASSATMSVKVASAIDKIIKVKASMSMEKQAIKEHSNRLLFEVEF